MKESLDKYYLALRAAMRQVDSMMTDIESNYPGPGDTPEDIELIYKEGNGLHSILSSVSYNVSILRTKWAQDI